jgi:hypothetical protein
MSKWRTVTIHTVTGQIQKMNHFNSFGEFGNIFTGFQLSGIAFG